jgi:hypothetical protein
MSGVAKSLLGFKMDVDRKYLLLALSDVIKSFVPIVLGCSMGLLWWHFVGLAIADYWLKPSYDWDSID